MRAGRAVRHARHVVLGLPDDSGGPSAARALRALRSNVRAAPAARPRPRRPRVSAFALGLPLVLLAAPAAEVRVLSWPGAATTVTVAAEPGITIADRTPGDTTLTADEVVFDRTNQIAEARGHVVLSDPETTTQGDFAHLNMDDESGWIENADADMHPSDYFLRAGRLDKKGGPQYSVANGVFTTCQCGGLEAPSWSIAGRRTDRSEERRVG